MKEHWISVLHSLPRAYERTLLLLRVGLAPDAELVPVFGHLAFSVEQGLYWQTEPLPPYVSRLKMHAVTHWMKVRFPEIMLADTNPVLGTPVESDPPARQ